MRQSPLLLVVLQYIRLASGNETSDLMSVPR